jgi:succinate dehydrogenase / fumarate reductase, cytochrome b subunit
MAKPASLVASSVGQKLLVGLTGLFLCTFLVVHLSGNLLLFKDDGGAAFNTYSEFMSTNVLVRTLEIVLFAGFLAHILFGVRVWLASRRARPHGYAVNRAGETSSFVSRWSFWTGSVVFIFLVIHMNSFWVPARFGGDASMYALVRTAFESPGYDAFYLVALFLLAFHLRHGFQSAFQTFGLRPGWQRPIDTLAMIFWLLIPIAFAAMPLFFLWKHHMGGGGI